MAERETSYFHTVDEGDDDARPALAALSGGPHQHGHGVVHRSHTKHSVDTADEIRLV